MHKAHFKELHAFSRFSFSQSHTVVSVDIVHTGKNNPHYFFKNEIYVIKFLINFVCPFFDLGGTS